MDSTGASHSDVHESLMFQRVMSFEAYCKMSTLQVKNLHEPCCNWIAIGLAFSWKLVPWHASCALPLLPCVDDTRADRDMQL